MNRIFRLLLAGLATVLTVGCATSNRQPLPEPLTLSEQGSFFVGGRDIRSEALSSSPNWARTGTITKEQMYVRYQVPARSTKVPITLIHGCCLTGKTWETTPDGRMGWDEYLVRSGHPTYVVDQVSRGRSTADPSAINDAKLGGAANDKIPTLFFASHEAAWAIFRFGPEYPKVFPGMQFPLESIGEFWKQMVMDWNLSLPNPNPNILAISQLSQRLKRTVLVSHSQSGILPFQAAALHPDSVAGIVAIEPGACPATGEPLQPYRGLPILVLWGEFVDASPFWAPRLKQCREFVAAANRAGAQAELVMLSDVGFAGASHMLMQDRNSLEIARWLDSWLDKRVSP